MYDILPVLTKCPLNCYHCKIQEVYNYAEQFIFNRNENGYYSVICSFDFSRVLYQHTAYRRCTCYRAGYDGNAFGITFRSFIRKRGSSYFSYIRQHRFTGFQRKGRNQHNLERTDRRISCRLFVRCAYRRIDYLFGLGKYRKQKESSGSENAEINKNCSPKKDIYEVLIILSAALAATVIVFALGIIRFHLLLPNKTFREVLLITLVPFIPGNIIKIVIMTILTKKLRPVLLNYIG